MLWRDTGFVLATRRHGENALIVDLLTREHGRHAGLARGGHLGTIACEMLRAHAARFLDDPGRLAGLTSAAALVGAALPEREPHGDVFTSFARLIEALDSAVDWPAQYVRWEHDLLSALGFGLDLSRCAVSGATAGLAYVSPRTGRAVSRTSGLPYHDRLLPLPEFLWRNTPADEAELDLGMTLTGHFLVHHVFAPQGRTLPAARMRLAERMREAAVAATIGG